MTRGSNIEKLASKAVAVTLILAKSMALKQKIMTRRGLKTREVYIQCKDEHTGREFQVKKLFHDGSVFFEFSCGCCIKDENVLDSTFNEGFSSYFTEGLIYGLGGKYKTKNNSLWSCPSFEKTHHRCCPKDPQLLHFLTEMIKKSRPSMLSGIRALNNSAFRKKYDRIKRATQFDTDPELHKSHYKTMMKAAADAHAFTSIMLGIFMPVFQSPASMPDQETLHVPFFKDRRLSKQSKEALQVKSAEISKEEALTDQQLVELFGGNSEQKERKPKFIKKKPNKGKAPNAIRKTQKPARL